MERKRTFSPQGEDAVALFPFDWYRTMRLTMPVYYHADRQIWDAFRSSEVEQILTDTETFLPFTPLQILHYPTNNTGQYRQEAICCVLDAFFTQPALEHLEMVIRPLIETLYERLPLGQPVDLMEQLAIPLPLLTIASLCGIPSTTWPLLRRWSEGLGAGEKILAPYPTALATYFRALCAQRRKASKEHDLISHLLAAQIGGRSLEEEDVFGCIAFLLGAGAHATSHLIGNALWMLDEDKSLTVRLREEPALIASFIEFVLLLRCPFPAIHKKATRAVVLASQHVPANAVVTAWIASANLDETRDVRFSLKSPLARLACRVALEVFCQRYRGLSRLPSVPLRRVGGSRYSTVYGLERLVVRLREARRGGWLYPG
ncbi:cytochrome P450 [Ktedonosporobacter rubrisoli]|uniref:Cytochrome P450 n=1 Tax=Ktedonosporobacter rubrisoli TaxID=2509675 RepID=A0A4P6K4M7_KTERU|nr:cytochrome P450 [Ktedonosporobacter rubrisoli]QBD82790.1 cytochrome P450 [Ktedonosporobacter rubrisoli]